MNNKIGLEIIKSLEESLDRKETEFENLRTENERLKAEILADLMEAPTNERMLKDVYEENERLQKAVDEAESIFGISEMFHGSTRRIDAWKKEYGKEIE